MSIINPDLCRQVAETQHVPSPDELPDIVVVPHTLAGFRAAFLSRFNRQPNEQEIWGAAIRSWRDLTDPNKAKELPLKITEADVGKLIASCNFTVVNNLTICVLILTNGHVVTGESACVAPQLFNAKLGQETALRRARDKIYELEGYVLRKARVAAGLQ